MRTGLIVEVPEAEVAVAEHRALLDPHARIGVPAHITVLYPFVPAPPDAGVLDRVRELVGAMPAFEYRLTHTAWFGAEVLWLAPEDDRPFRALTSSICAAFPEFLPYQGKFEPVPHLTI